jgi:hypothetical protein
MKRLFYIIKSVFICSLLTGQVPVGSWSDHLRYNAVSSLAITPGEIYASTGSSILILNREYNELRKLSTLNGLSETGISTIGWSDEHKILIVAYLNSNLDFITGNTVYNLPDILYTDIPAGKKINRIRTRGRFAYLTTGFGIVVADLVKLEINDTWRPGSGSGSNEVFDISFGNEMVYAATEDGLWQAEITNQGLSYSGNWKRIISLPDPSAECTDLIFSGNVLYCNVSHVSDGDVVYAISDEVRIFSSSPSIINRSFDAASNGFTISSNNSLKYYDSEGILLNEISSYRWGEPDAYQAIVTGDDIWIADNNYGIVLGENLTGFTSFSLSGPATNDVANITSTRGKTIICAGGTDNSWNGMNKKFQVSIHENQQFSNIISETHYDAIRSYIDPGRSNHFFVSSWSDGLFEYSDNILVKLYNSSNSPLQNSSATGSSIKICGMVMDKLRNLWITQTDVSGSIKILKPDGTWIVYPLTIDAPVIGDIISSESSQNWILLPGGHGVFIIDHNETPDIFEDDRTRKLTIKDNDDRVINNVFSAVEDLDGQIWIGTDQGPVIYHDIDRVFEEDARGNRIKVPRDDGSGLAYYMLGTESVTAIAVDGANRKWLGTRNSGVYLLSPDGTAVLKNFNTQNSPLFSDSIASVAVDNTTGEVWFGTSRGVISLREIAVTGKKTYNDVYSFPNPVREDYSGNVTINGLIRDTRIKITDISGNLVCELLSQGGQAGWDLRTYNGRRVTSGVYLVFCENIDGSESCVTKILIIGK